MYAVSRPQIGILVFYTGLENNAPRLGYRQQVSTVDGGQLPGATNVTDADQGDFENDEDFSIKSRRLVGNLPNANRVLGLYSGPKAG